MSFIRCYWFIVLIGGVSFFMPIVLLLYMHKDIFVQEPVVVKTNRDKVEDYFDLGFSSSEVESLIQNLKDRDGVLEEREKEIKELESRINQEKVELQGLQKEIENNRKELEQYVISVQESETKNVRNLVAIYSEMEPASVVAVFDEMQEEQVLQIMSMMKQETVTALFEEMISRKAGTADEGVKEVAAFTDKLRRVLSQKTKP